jgi:hypothetical protein
MEIDLAAAATFSHSERPVFLGPGAKPIIDQRDNSVHSR